MYTHTFLIIGCGGREHAIAKKLVSESSKVCCVGEYINPDIYDLCKGCYILIPESVPAAVRFAQIQFVDCVIIGPEKYLELGWADAFYDAGFPVVGPSFDHAKIETSKRYCRQLLRDHPQYQPGFKVITHLSQLDAILNEYSDQVV